MIRKLLTSSLLGLLVATGAQAGGLIPGSDTFVRSEDTVQSHAVVTGTYRENGPAVLETQSYGYALKDGQDRSGVGTGAFDDARTQGVAPALRGMGRTAPAVGAKMVPGSDSF